MPKKNNQPNIIFIMSDDHAAHAIGAYGSKINETPHMDRIAREGARFDRCFCTNSICEPSRAAILCGTYNHINGVTTIGAHIDNRLDNVAKEFQKGGYQTGMIGKWHLGEAKENEPTGFDHWNILPGQGLYHDPVMYGKDGEKVYPGYVTDLITDQSLDWIERRDREKPFFLMLHHKAPHRRWEPKEDHMSLYAEDRELPETLFDDYSHRSEAAKNAHMRIAIHMKYSDIKCQPPKGAEYGDMVPHPKDTTGFFLVKEETGEKVSFANQEELLKFKYQRYIKDYLRCIASVDDNIGRVLDYLDKEGLADDTVVIYTSDQGFFLGDHGWYDKRFMYEESLKMPFLMRYPDRIAPGTKVDAIINNVDFAPTFLELAGLPVPDYMQGTSFTPLLNGTEPDGWQQSCYYRYWMHLEHHYVPAHYGVRTKTEKLIYYYGDACGQPNTIDDPKIPEWEYFDLTSDPRELVNRYDDPDCTGRVAALKEELARLQEKVGDNPFVPKV